MAYAAVIDLRVSGLEDVTALESGVKSLTKRIKSVPSLFREPGTSKKLQDIRKQTRELEQQVIKLANGTGKLSTTTAGLNQQLGALQTVAANTTVGTTNYEKALQAAERASRSLARAEVARLNVLNDIYTANTKQPGGASVNVKEILDLGKTIPNSIAGLEFYETQLRDLLRLVTVGSADFFRLGQAIDQVGTKLAAARGVGPLQGPVAPPVQGPALPLGGVKRPRVAGTGTPSPQGPTSSINPLVRRTAAFENLALGAGFPLLFGGGPAQIVGGLLGSFVGTGFGGQILGSALAQQLADAVNRIAEIGGALDQLNMDALRDSAITVNSELAYQVSLLQKAGQADAARAAIGNELLTQTGVFPEAIKDITNNSNLLKNVWDELTAAFSGTLSIIGIPFISAITGILKVVAMALKGVNLIASGVGLIIKRVVELVGKIPFIGRVLAFIQEKTKAILEDEEQQIVAIRQLTDEQHKQLVNVQKVTQLEAQRTLGRTTAEKRINNEIDRQIAKERIRAEYAEKAQNIREKHGNVETEQGRRALALALEQNAALENQALKQEKIKKLLQDQSLQIEANTAKYDEAAEAVRQQIAALERGNQVTQSRYSAEAALNDLYGAQLQRQYELAETAKERAAIAVKMFEQQTRAAEIEYQISVNNNALLVQKAKLEADLVVIKYKQLEAEKAIAIAQAKSRGNTPEHINEIALAYDKGLNLQRNAVEAAFDQIQATAEIARNQDLVAAAVFKTKVIQAESQLAQKLVSDEIGMSAQQANNLAGRLAVGVLQSRQMAGAMATVAAQAANASRQIGNAVSMQTSLNAAQASGRTVTKQTGSSYQATYNYGGGKTGYASIQAHYATGGFVNKPTRALIGEAGPEYVVPAGKARDFSMRYLAGARGESAMASSGGGAGSGPVNINIRTGPVMRQNGQNYVSVGDLEQALQTFADTMLRNNRTPGGRRYAGIG